VRQFYKALIAYANEATEAAQHNVASLQREILDLKQRMAEKNAALDLAKSAVNRLDSFQPEIGGNLQCPDCWIVRSVHSDLRPIDSKGADLFKCRTCYLDITV
jgi:hypothetical protein